MKFDMDRRCDAPRTSLINTDHKGKTLFRQYELSYIDPRSPYCCQAC